MYCANVIRLANIHQARGSVPVTTPRLARFSHMNCNSSPVSLLARSLSSRLYRNFVSMGVDQKSNDTASQEYEESSRRTIELDLTSLLKAPVVAECESCRLLKTDCCSKHSAECLCTRRARVVRFKDLANNAYMDRAMGG